MAMASPSSSSFTGTHFSLSSYPTASSSASPPRFSLSPSFVCIASPHFNTPADHHLSLRASPLQSLTSSSATATACRALQEWPCPGQPSYSSETEEGDHLTSPANSEYREHSLHGTDHRSNVSKGGSAGVPVYVMLPLDSINTSNNNKTVVNRRKAMDASLMALKSAGVEGIMVDVWWGIVERDGCGRYDWSGYADLFAMVRNHGLKIQAVMSFHQCGGNVGDSCFIPLPGWVVEEIDCNPDLSYTDRHGRRNYEYLSLGCDMLPVLKGRTPIQVYSDYMRSFRDTFKDLLGNTIVEVQVGMGPAGELRYPSYPESNGTWRFPGIGEFQCYDKYMLSSLKAAATAIGKPQWGNGGPSDAGCYNNWPEDTNFFKKEGGWNMAYGVFFLEWYSSMLLAHGERLLSSAKSIFSTTGIKLSGKVAGIHWHYNTRAHPAELTAGYYNTRFRDGYLPIARMFGRHGVVLNFTCIEMKDYEQPSEAGCSPENLIKQVVLAARKASVPVAGENALPRYDDGAHKQVIKNSRLAYNDDPHGVSYEPMCAFTYLRMNQHLFQGDNWRLFVHFVRQMAEGKACNVWEEEHKASELVHATRPLVQEAAAALA